MKRIMIDIETLGTGANSAIISIGAVRFDFDRDRCVDRGDRFAIGGVIDNGSENFECFVDVQDSMINGGVADGATITWWFDQIKNGNYPYPDGTVQFLEEDALVALSDFVGDDAKEIWCNGTDFDIVILRSAFERYAMLELPWKHLEVRDMRTVVKMFDPEKRKRTVESAKHSALGDAIDQANWLIAVVNSINGN